MILYQPVDFDLIPTNIFVPKILPGVFRYTGDCRYSSIHCKEYLNNAILRDVCATYAIDPTTWLAYITHPVISQNLSDELSLELFSLEENCFLFDWVEHQVYLGEQRNVRSFLDHVRAGWLLPPIRRNPDSIDLKITSCVDHQAYLVGLLRMTLDQRLRLN